MAWKEVDVIHKCQKCGKKVAKEKGSLRDGDSVDLYCVCKECKK